MQAQIIVTPAIDPIAQSLAGIETDMLLLGYFLDGGRGPVQLFDQVTNGNLVQLLASRNFTGDLGRRFTYKNPEGAQKHLLVVGFGVSTQFDGVAIARVLGIAIHKALKHGCKKLSIPFFPDRLDGSMKLASQAQVIHEAAVVKLREYPGDNELVIELLCVTDGAARRQLERGLAMRLTGRVGRQHVDNQSKKTA